MSDSSNPGQNMVPRDLSETSVGYETERSILEDIEQSQRKERKR